MINPITVQETSKATRFELHKNAEAYQLMNEASRQTEPKPTRVGRVRLFIGLTLIRIGSKFSNQQSIPVPEGKSSR